MNRELQQALSATNVAQSMKLNKFNATNNTVGRICRQVWRIQIDLRYKRGFQARYMITVLPDHMQLEQRLSKSMLCCCGLVVRRSGLVSF